MDVDAMVSMILEDSTSPPQLPRVEIIYDLWIWTPVEAFILYRLFQKKAREWFAYRVKIKKGHSQPGVDQNTNPSPIGPDSLTG